MAEATAAVAAASSCREAVAAVNVTMAVPLPCPDIEVYHIILAVKFHSHYMTTQCTFTDEFLVACTSANVAPVRGAVKEKQKYCILYAEYIINKNRRKKKQNYFEQITLVLSKNSSYHHSGARMCTLYKSET